MHLYIMSLIFLKIHKNDSGNLSPIGIRRKKKTKEKLKKLGDPKIWSKEEGHVLGPFIGPPF